MELTQGRIRRIDVEEVWTMTLVLCTVSLLARPFLPSGGSRRPCTQILFVHQQK
jgi:hypothetical protein